MGACQRQAGDKEAIDIGAWALPFASLADGYAAAHGASSELPPSAAPAWKKALQAVRSVCSLARSTLQ